MAEIFSFSFSFFLVSGVILERSRVESVLNRERDGAEQCGEVFSAEARVKNSSMSCER